MKWQPYPQYKPSGVEWLGEIPGHWGTKRLKFLATEPLKYGANESAELEDPDLPRFIRITDISEGGFLRDDTFKSLPEEIAKPFLLGYGDLLFARSGATVGKTFMYRESWGRSCYAGYLIRFRANSIEILPEFISYFTVSSSYWGWLSSVFIQATIQNVSAEKYANLVISIPPSEEQVSIISFLNRETAHIDALVEKKQRQIELLQEKRGALISHAVTKGLNPHVELKDSGIEWIEEIPVSWEIKRLKFLASEPLKYGANESAEIDDPDLPRYIRITDITEGGSLRDDTFKSLPEKSAEPFLLNHGDILLARSGATAGKTFMYQDSWGKACYAGYLIRLRTKLTEAMPEFLSYFTNSSIYWGWLSSVFIQATIQNVSAEKYANMVVVTPPVEEQREIVAFLDQETAQIDTLIAKIQEGIDMLQEYRTALISAAVTGKIDVREAAA